MAKRFSIQAAAIRWPKLFSWGRWQRPVVRSRKQRENAVLADPRRLEGGNDTFDAVLLTLETAIVGRGIVPRPATRTTYGTPDLDTDARLAELYAAWARAATVDGTPEADAQALALRRYLVDGEVFAVHADDGQYQLVTAADVPLTLNGSDDGILVDQYGRRLAFVFQPGGVGERVTVPAERVAHFAYRMHPWQRRGISPLQSVAQRVVDTNEYDASERTAARVASHAAFFVKREAGGAMVDDSSDPEPVDLTSGTLYDDLAPGDELGAVNVNRPNPELVNFRSAQLRSIAAASGADYHVLSRDFSGTYSSARQAMLEAFRTYERTFDRMVSALELRKWTWLVDGWLASGRLRVPATVEPRTLYAPAFELPRLPWIDPKRESEATDTQINNGTLSRRAAIRIAGRDPDTTIQEIEADGGRPARRTENPTPTPTET